MTATQLFVRFLRETCEPGEYLFFRHIISNDNGNKFFTKRPLFKRDFVEGYLSRNNRHLGNFITRLFILAPNLINKRENNPRWNKIIQQHTGPGYRRFNRDRGKGIYFNYYRNSWYNWLYKRLDFGGKSIYSPFKKGEKVDFKFRTT